MLTSLNSSARYGRYGPRRIAELLRSTAGWVVDDKRVEPIWRQEGLKVPANQAEGICGLMTGPASVCDPNGQLCLELRLREGSHP
jgi:hypothetical protein